MFILSESVYLEEDDLNIDEIISEIDHSYESLRQELLSEISTTGALAVGVALYYHKQIFRWIEKLISLMTSFREKVLGWFQKIGKGAARKFGGDTREIVNDISRSKAVVRITPDDPNPYDYRMTYRNKIKPQQLKALLLKIDTYVAGDNYLTSPETMGIIKQTFGIRSSDEDDSINALIRSFVSGPRIRKEIKYTRRDARFIGEVLVNTVSEQSEIDNMFQTVLGEMEKAKKALNKEINKKEIKVLTNKINLLRIISSEYISARMRMISAVEIIAFKLKNEE